MSEREGGREGGRERESERASERARERDRDGGGEGGGGEKESGSGDLVAIEGIREAVVAARVGGRGGRDCVLAQGGAIHELRHVRHQTRQPTLLAFRVVCLVFCV